ncbi:MAG: MFS transporter [Acidobacteria bacterium]|nr:MAG: MFS transporter [Acidobacteriota bacterium]
MAGVLYKRLGLPNDVIALATSWLLLPWSLKPIWSPLLEMFKTKKFFIVLFEVVGGLSLALVALSLPLPGFFRYSIAFFAVTAFCSATHDIAADGLYIASLSSKQQASFAGWQGGFFNVARFFSQGGLVILAGFLESRVGTQHAWMSIFVFVGIILVLVGLYHARVLPKGGTERSSQNFSEMYRTFVDVLATFFRKPNIWLLLIFILLYRAGEGQVVRIGPLFLLGSRAEGGLGLTTDQFGAIYGTAGTVAFILGSILGGYFAARLGLKKAIIPLICAMNFPNVAYLYLSIALPQNPFLVGTAMSVEMFGYGFGFVGVILLMMQEIAPGPYQTAHYAFATALMNLGLMLPGTVSGKIQMAIGYRNFFLWVLISCLPALILARFIPIGRRAAGSEVSSSALEDSSRKAEVAAKRNTGGEI